MMGCTPRLGFQERKEAGEAETDKGVFQKKTGFLRLGRVLHENGKMFLEHCLRSLGPVVAWSRFFAATEPLNMELDWWIYFRIRLWEFRVAGVFLVSSRL